MSQAASATLPPPQLLCYRVLVVKFARSGSPSARVPRLATEAVLPGLTRLLGLSVLNVHVLQDKPRQKSYVSVVLAYSGAGVCGN